MTSAANQSQPERGRTTTPSSPVVHRVGPRAYTVNATWGFNGATATATSTFQYTATGTQGSGGPSNYFMTVNIQATYIASTGYVGISILTSSPTGTLDDVATWSPFHIHYPDGTLHNICNPGTAAGAVCLGTYTRVHTGYYYVNFTLPATALQGLYGVHAGTTDANGVTGEGLGTFTVQPASSGGSGPGTTTTVTQTVTATSSGSSPDAAALAAIQTQLSGISTTLSAVQTTVNGISTGVTGITNTLGTFSTGIGQVAGISGQLTTLTNSVNNNQTYVLVVAALAAITLVLELAILVRKLS